MEQTFVLYRKTENLQIPEQGIIFPEFHTV